MPLGPRLAERPESESPEQKGHSCRMALPLLSGRLMAARRLFLLAAFLALVVEIASRSTDGGADEGTLAGIGAAGADQGAHGGAAGGTGSGAALRVGHVGAGGKGKGRGQGDGQEVVTHLHLLR